MILHGRWEIRHPIGRLGWTVTDRQTLDRSDAFETERDVINHAIDLAVAAELDDLIGALDAEFPAEPVRTGERRSTRSQP